MADAIYTNATKLLADGTVDWDNGGHTYRCLLLGTGYTPDVDADIFVADIVAQELSGTGYVRKDLTNRAVVKDDANNRSDYNADNPTWTGLDAGTIAFVAVFKLVTNDADSPLLVLLDPSDLVTNGSDVTLRFGGASGSGPVFRIAAA